MKHKIPKCHQCGSEMVHRISPPHRVKMRYEGSPHDVLVENMPEWHCAACCVSVTDGESDESLQDALRDHIGLLSPQKIKTGLRELRISQDKFAERLGCAAESVSRWLNGASLQSRAYDRLMRIYFHFPAVRGLLENYSPEASFGDTVVHALATDSKSSESPESCGGGLSPDIQTQAIKDLKTELARCLASTLFSQLSEESTLAAPSSGSRLRQFGAIVQEAAGLKQFGWERGGTEAKSSASRIPEWAWTGVGGEAS
jgi:DNA-binding transcriptional regulator YiaG